MLSEILLFFVRCSNHIFHIEQRSLTYLVDFLCFTAFLLTTQAYSAVCDFIIPRFFTLCYYYLFLYLCTFLRRESNCLLSLDSCAKCVLVFITCMLVTQAEF